MKNIHLWNVRGLAEDLKGDRVSEKQAFLYFVIGVVLGLLVTYETVFVGEPYTLPYTLDWFLFGVVTIWGVWYCFTQNEKGDGKSFLNRFMSLSLPTSIRFFVLILVLGFILALVYGMVIGADFPDETSLFARFMIMSGGFALISVAYFLWLGRWIARVSGVKPMPPSKNVAVAE